MTRKRFTKMLMAGGYTRNEVEHFARFNIDKLRRSYDELFVLVCLFGQQITVKNKRIIRIESAIEIYLAFMAWKYDDAELC